MSSEAQDLQLGGWMELHGPMPGQAQQVSWKTSVGFLTSSVLIMWFPAPHAHRRCPPSSNETANTQLPRNTSMLRDKPEAPSHSPR